MTTTYNGLQFKTPLEARWAAFFDLAKWKWEVNPVAIDDWQPDFRVTFKCSHSECGGSHTLLVTVLPITEIEGFKSHPCLSYSYGMKNTNKGPISIGADAGAAFGAAPNITYWEMSHGSGGGVESVIDWANNADELWRKAGASIVTSP